MPARFRNLGFGPLELRPLLRSVLEPDERAVGWATSSPDAPMSLTFLRLAAMMIPGLGHIVAMGLSSALGPRRSLMLLTDRRLLLVDRDRTGELILTRNIPIDELGVATGALGVTFVIMHMTSTPDPLPRLAAQTIDANQCHPAARLHQALTLLARDEETRDDKPPAPR